MSQLFRVRGTLTPRMTVLVQVVGLFVALGLWHLLAVSGVVHRGILPPPLKVVQSFGPLLQDGLLYHAYISTKMNVLGYVEAVVICGVLGFVLGLFPGPKALSEKPLASARFLPLPPLTGIFIAAFGIGTAMKVHFLALGIIVYLLPTVVQRVSETQEVYVQTARTLGATPWQQIYKVFIPDVLSRGFDDVRILVAISWTYITIAEVINSSGGGLGAMAYIASRQSSVEKTYAILLVVLLIGWVQDWLLKRADRMLFPHKYA